MMMSYGRRACFASLGVVGAMVGSGCAWLGPVEDPTRFYVLEVPNYRVVSDEVAAKVSVGIGRVQVARYLDSPGVTIREGNNRIVHAQRYRWAESIQHGLSRVLGDNLRREPVVAQVAMEAAQRRQPLDYDLHISVLRAEGIAAEWEPSRAVFHATWELRTGLEAEVVARGRVHEDNLPWDGYNFDQLVASISGGVEGLSQQVARALQDLSK